MTCVCMLSRVAGVRQRRGFSPNAAARQLKSRTLLRVTRSSGPQTNPYPSVSRPRIVNSSKSALFSECLQAHRKRHKTPKKQWFPKNRLSTRERSIASDYTCLKLIYACDSTRRSCVCMCVILLSACYCDMHCRSHHKQFFSGCFTCALVPVKTLVST